MNFDGSGTVTFIPRLDQSIYFFRTYEELKIVLSTLPSVFLEYPVKGRMTTCDFKLNHKHTLSILLS